MASFEQLLVAVLSVWRLTHLLNSEDGPGHILVRLRKSAGDGFFGQLLDCFYCLSLWIAAPAAFLISSQWKQGLAFWLAISGAACLLERATSERNPLADFVHEEKEENTDLLR